MRSVKVVCPAWHRPRPGGTAGHLTPAGPALAWHVDWVIVTLWRHQYLLSPGSPLTCLITHLTHDSSASLDTLITSHLRQTPSPSTTCLMGGFSYLFIYSCHKIYKEIKRTRDDRDGDAYDFVYIEPRTFPLSLITQ